MEEQQFTFYWQDGKRTMCFGADPADALNKVGYGAGAIRALDFYAHGDNKDYIWNPDTRNWDATEEALRAMGARP